MSTIVEQYISSVFQLLNEQVRYAVLRNYACLPQTNVSRDIDIVITKQDLKRIKVSMLQIMESLNWKLVNYLKSDRLTTFVCGKLDENDGALLVQWDFFVHTSVYGIVLMSAEECLKNRIFNGILYHVTPEIEFLDKYLYYLAVGQPYPEKYGLLKQKMGGNEYVQKILKTVFGCETIEKCDYSSSHQLRFHALAHRLSTSISSLGELFGFIMSYIENYLSSSTGFSIGFTGVDGVGKTTVIHALLQELSSIFSNAHVLLHFRPGIYGNLGEVAHKTGLKKTVDNNFEKPHRGTKTGRLSSLLRLIYYTVDYQLGFWLKVKSTTRFTKLVIFDRYYTDVICDGRRSRIFLSERFLTNWGRCLVPSLDFMIFLIADPEKIRQRKNELTLNEIKLIQEREIRLATQPNCLLVKNEDTPRNAVYQVLQFVFERQHLLNKRRMGAV
jgi:thymidylate kinase